jgi:hypothetical protein
MRAPEGSATEPERTGVRSVSSGEEANVVFVPRAEALARMGVARERERRAQKQRKTIHMQETAPRGDATSKAFDDRTTLGRDVAIAHLSA